MRGSAIHEKSLESSIKEFFAANPNEELTIDDAVIKFDAWSKNAVRNRFCNLAAQGPLERISVYRLKPKDQS